MKVIRLHDEKEPDATRYQVLIALTGVEIEHLQDILHYYRGPSEANADFCEDLMGAIGEVTEQ